MYRKIFMNICVSACAALALYIIPSVSVAQICSYLEVYQEFSLDDTFNSSGSPLDDAFVVFQQDRFYVNQKNRLDPNDKPDPVMINSEARATYGQAIRSYLNANGMGQMSPRELIGSQYIVELEVCGSQKNPSIQIVSIRIGGDIEDNSWELEIEYREAELAETKQRLNQREADLNEWERQLKEWERRLADIQYNLEQQAVAKETQRPKNDLDLSLLSGVPNTMLSLAGGLCSSLIDQAIKQSSSHSISFYTNRNGVWAIKALGTDTCRRDALIKESCRDIVDKANIVEVSTNPLVLEQRSPNCTSIQEFMVTNGAGHHVSTNTEELCPMIYKFRPEMTANVIHCRLE